jgi:hypothetical protein
MEQDETHAPRPEQTTETPKPKRGYSKPLSLHPLTVEEAPKRTFEAGPLPKKPRQKTSGKRGEKGKQHGKGVSRR